MWKKLEDQAKFCPVCGEKVKDIGNQPGVSSSIEKPVRVKRSLVSKKAVSMVLVAVILLIGIFGVKSVISPGYMKPVKLLEKGLTNLDVNTCKKAYSPKLRENTDVDGDMIMLGNVIEEIENDKNSNIKLKIKLDVTEKTKIEKDVLEETLTSTYGAYPTDAQEAKAAYDLKVKATIHYTYGDQDSESENETIHLCVAKIGFKWYLVGEEY